jgi:hypothetical protein
VRDAPRVLDRQPADDLPAPEKLTQKQLAARKNLQGFGPGQMSFGMPNSSHDSSAVGSPNSLLSLSLLLPAGLSCTTTFLTL